MIFWYDIMNDCKFPAMFIGLFISWICLNMGGEVWARTGKFHKKYLIVPLVSIILGFCYYIGMERLLFEAIR